MLGSPPNEKVWSPTNGQIDPFARAHSSFIDEKKQMRGRNVVIKRTMHPRAKNHSEDVGANYRYQYKSAMGEEDT